MARGVEHCIDDDRLSALLGRWRREGRRRFIVWAGFWLPVLERYRQSIGGEPLAVDHCRIDAVVSASFKVHADLDAAGREIWLWDGATRRIVHEIGVVDAARVPFAERDERLVVHGGGWGIGTYRDTLPELGRSRYALDVVVHDRAEAGDIRACDRAFMLDPQWSVWNRDAEGDVDFPPMCCVTDGELQPQPRHRDRHLMHDVIRASRAVVSKPGGCTLIDSLAAATPVVLLEPYGYAEKANSEIWKRLGFGVDYESWRASGFDGDVLARLHANIASRRRGIDYALAYASEVAEVCA